MKITNEEFKIKTEKLESDKSICLLGDVHVRPNTSYGFLDMLINSIKENIADLIVIDGDFGFTPDDFYNSKCSAKIQYLISSLSAFKPVFIVPGNHDMQNGKRYPAGSGIAYLKSLESISNTKVLINEQYKLDDFNITGFCPSIETYRNKYRNEWFKFYVNDFISSLFAFNDEIFNIFITHSPKIVSDSFIVDKLREWYTNIDLILCAHMHDGYVPRFIQARKLQDSDKGIAFGDPEKCRNARINVVDKCRGIHDVESAKMVVTRGVRKYVLKNRLCDLIDKNASHDITSIKLERK